MSNAANTKESFVSWLISRDESSQSIDEHIVNLESIAISYSQYLSKPFSIWEVTEPKQLDAIINAGTSSKNAEKLFPSVTSKISLLTLKKYLIELKYSEDETHIEWRTQSSVDNEIDFKRKLDSATMYLQDKYKDSPVQTLRKLQKDNREINFTYFNTWTQQLFGKTASQYLTEKGVLCEKVIDSRSSSEKLAECTLTLQSRYSKKTAESLSQVINENPDISISMINIWARELFNQTAKDYLIAKGIIHVAKEPIKKSNESAHKKISSVQNNSVFQHISIREGKKLTGFYYDGEKIIDAYPRKKDKFTFYIHERMPIHSGQILKYSLVDNPNYSESDKFKFKGYLSKESILQLICDSYSVKTDASAESSYESNASKNITGSSQEKPTIDNSVERVDIDSPFQTRVENAILEVDLEGITPDELASNISSSVLSVKKVRDLSNKIIDLNGIMIHVDALVDFEDASFKIHEIIEKLLNKNSGYISSAQLFEYVRSELQMFLNDNNLCDEQKVFDIAKFLFSKTNWRGYHYEFSVGKHISRTGEKALRTNLDIFEKFARDMGGVFQWDDLLKYLDKVGVKTGNLRGQMRIGFEPIFFYVTSEELITVESMTIDEKWLNHAHRALDNLFNDVGDHIVIRNIAPFWYEQLPELPHRIQWTPLLLQYVLQFYGKQLGARTIHSELSTQYDSIHSLLVKDESDLHSFGDAVIAFVIDNGINERRYQAEEFRKILAYGKLIGNFENIRNMQRAIGNDTRFAWDATGEVLTLLI